MFRSSMKGGTLVLAAALAVAACKKETPAPVVETPQAPAPSATLSVSAIDIGKSIGADKRVSMPTTTFGVRDTIYASVATEGAPPTAILAARWSFLGGGQTTLVDSTSQTIAPTGPAVTEFHVSKPDGWPKGSYRVEVFSDGNSVGTRDFEVR